MDNDIALKACCYGSTDHLIECITSSARTIHVLGAMRFVLSKRIRKSRNISDKDAAANRLSELLTRVALIEPDEQELALAADFEEAAQSTGVDLDGGESQLLAVLIRRSAVLLLTGDKRAIQAMGPIVTARGLSEGLANRVACLEQIAQMLVNRHGADLIHRCICSEPEIDKALAICFSCASGCYSSETIRRALRSYINDLRTRAPGILVDSDDLSTVIPQEDGIG